jgi:hypothetical protein
MGDQTSIGAITDLAFSIARSYVGWGHRVDIKPAFPRPDSITVCVWTDHPLGSVDYAIDLGALGMYGREALRARITDYFDREIRKAK